MKPSEYIKLTGATDHRTYEAVQERLQDERNARLFHYFTGISTESGELQDTLKKTVIYGKSLDIANLKEELGDVLWYIARACDVLGFTFEEVMQTNMDKLKLRYGDKFTEHAALNRDIDAERKLLEDAVDGK